MARVKTRRPGTHLPCSSTLLQWSWTQRLFITFTTVLVAALLLLANHSRPQHDSGNHGLHRNRNFPRKQLASGNEVKFLESKHNLQHSNLSELPVQDTISIFEGPPALIRQDAEEGALHVNKSGFLANVKPADLQGASAVKSTPVSSSNPLGYYFNQDKAAAAMGKLQSAHSVLEKPSGQNKAALGYYFNKEQPQTAQIEQAGREGTLQPYEGDKDVAAADGGIARQGKGLSSVVQTSVYMHPGQHAANGKPRTAVAAMPHAQLQADLQVGLYAT